MQINKSYNILAVPRGKRVTGALLSLRFTYQLEAVTNAAVLILDTRYFLYKLAIAVWLKFNNNFNSAKSLNICYTNDTKQAITRFDHRLNN